MTTDSRTFDYHWLRAFVGVIAIAIPIVVWGRVGCRLDSISAYYHTNARDYFVGLLFIVGSFLFAYNGTSAVQAVLSKFGGLAAWAVAMFPTRCQPGDSSCINCIAEAFPILHYVGAVGLFGVLIYFCL